MNDRLTEHCRDDYNNSYPYYSALYQEEPLWKRVINYLMFWR